MSGIGIRQQDFQAMLLSELYDLQRRVQDWGRDLPIAELTGCQKITEAQNHVERIFASLLADLPASLPTANIGTHTFSQAANALNQEARETEEKSPSETPDVDHRIQEIGKKTLGN
ncbi:MAG: hypothetical protein AAGI90_04720 [Chlamydiota bacterium]